MWNNDSASRTSLTAYSVNGTVVSTGRGGWVVETDIETPLTFTLYGVKQYSVALEGYSGPCNSTSQTGDLWFDSGSDATVSLPVNYTEGMVRTVFVGWADGSTNNTVMFPAIDESHSLAPVLKTQYFVYIIGSSLFSPVPIQLEQLPQVTGGFVFYPSNSRVGAWFDEGASVPLAVASWSQTGVNDSKLLLTAIDVYFMFNYTEESSIIFVTNGTGVSMGTYTFMYGAVGGGLNASSAKSGGFSAVFVNGTLVGPVVPADEMPKIVDGQLVVDRPYYLSYVYTPLYYFDLSTPFGGFHGWVDEQSLQFPSTFTYSAPELAGFLGTERFSGWSGTVNATGRTLSLVVEGAVVETASYSVDYGAVTSVIASAAVLAVGAYVLVSRRYLYRRST